MRVAVAVAIACSVTVGFTATSHAAPTYFPTLFVPNLLDNKLVPVRLPGGTPGAPTPVGATPFAVSITPDGKTAYTADDTGDTITPVDVRTGVAGSPIPAGDGPVAIAITANGKTAYVANTSADGGFVTPIDLVSGTKRPSIYLGMRQAADLALAPDGAMLYVAAGGVIPINLATMVVGQTITTPYEPMDIGLTPNGTTAYVANFGGHSVTPIDLATRKTGPSISVGAPQGIAIAPNGKTVYTVDILNNTLIRIDTATNKRTATVPMSAQPSSVVITPSGTTLYVTEYNAGFVVPVDVATLTVGAAIAVPHPGRPAITPDQAPVANFTATPASHGTPTSFDASASRVRFGKIAKYAWTFGDGTSAITTGPLTSHTYAHAGSYTTTLRETSSAGTSTSRVFTGRTVLRNGGPSAKASRAFIVS